MHAACIGQCRPFLALLTLLLLVAPAPADVVLPGGERVTRVDFERHVMGLFGRLGCNSGSCHGSFQGKGGLRLSLFGYEPEKDYLALSRDLQGRRIDRGNPDNSLLLLKGTGQVPHGGLTRFGQQSWPYQLLRAWIAEGAVWKKGSGAVAAIQITPAEYAFERPGQSGAFRVEATFQDGSRETITSLCDFRTNDDAIVEVTSLGQLRALRPGDTAVIVSYRGNVLPVRVLVPAPTAPDFRYPSVPEVNYIDREVFAKLRRLNITPSNLSSDQEFLRRVTLDTIGALPRPDEVRSFLADARPDKRARKIDELLAHPLHAALWATRLCDITGNNTDTLENPPQRRAQLSQMWHDWFRKRIADNMPYDEIVRGVLCATTREGHTPEEYVKQAQEEEAVERGFNAVYANRATLDLFWRRQANVPIEQWGEKTAAAFLGVRLECAQCHKHPFDRWTQTDYRAYASVFSPVLFGVPSESQTLFRAKDAERTGAKTDKKVIPPRPLREVYLAMNPKRGPLVDPDTNKRLVPRALGGPEIPLRHGEDPRLALFDWLRGPDNPFFARSFANRVWGHYLGVGVVHPVDDFSLANPPSNDRLLNALAQDFVACKYDLRQLERTILNSRTYQLTSAVNDTNRLDRTNYSHSYVRPLMAEVVVDILNDAIGMPEKDFGPFTTTGGRAIEVGASRVQNGLAAYAFRIFGRPPRSSACDCERAMEPGLPQKLFLMADPQLQNKVRAPQNRLAALLASHEKDDDALDELFLATLSRRPTEAERASFAAYRSKKDRQKAFVDTLWALLNTTEFIFNH
jgi:hypothetical protein